MVSTVSSHDEPEREGGGSLILRPSSNRTCSEDAAVSVTATVNEIEMTTLDPPPRRSSEQHVISRHQHRHRDAASGAPPSSCASPASHSVRRPRRTSSTSQRRRNRQQQQQQRPSMPPGPHFPGGVVLVVQRHPHEHHMVDTTSMTLQQNLKRREHQVKHHEEHYEDIETIFHPTPLLPPPPSGHHARSQSDTAASSRTKSKRENSTSSSSRLRRSASEPLSMVGMAGFKSRNLTETIDEDSVYHGSGSSMSPVSEESQSDHLRPARSEDIQVPKRRKFSFGFGSNKSKSRSKSMDMTSSQEATKTHAVISDKPKASDHSDTLQTPAFDPLRPIRHRFNHQVKSMGQREPNAASSSSVSSESSNSAESSKILHRRHSQPNLSPRKFSVGRSTSFQSILARDGRSNLDLMRSLPPLPSQEPHRRIHHPRSSPTQNHERVSARSIVMKDLPRPPPVSRSQSNPEKAYNHGKARKSRATNKYAGSRTRYGETHPLRLDGNDGSPAGTEALIRDRRLAPLPRMVSPVQSPAVNSDIRAAESHRRQCSESSTASTSSLGKWDPRKLLKRSPKQKPSKECQQTGNISTSDRSPTSVLQDRSSPSVPSSISSKELDLPYLEPPLSSTRTMPSKLLYPRYNIRSSVRFSSSPSLPVSAAGKDVDDSLSPTSECSYSDSPSWNVESHPPEPARSQPNRIESDCESKSAASLRARMRRKLKMDSGSDIGPSIKSLPVVLPPPPLLQVITLEDSIDISCSSDASRSSGDESRFFCYPSVHPSPALATMRVFDLCEDDAGSGHEIRMVDITSRSPVEY